jgi:hypothetical protein
MSKVTQLASGQINGHDTITVELIEADETPAVVIVRWPSKPTVLHPVASPLLLTLLLGRSLPLRYGWQRSAGSVGSGRHATTDIDLMAQSR